ncbi:hypothetical protein [Hymenobacter sp. UYP22]|uniref:hypothetical protein n=1 Tax=Hymenobacter sp. UYP22 TaxID=3156348 RepID=UPI003396964D
MKTEEINQALTLFDTPEKWDAFISLAKHHEQLKQAMFQKAFVRISRYFRSEHQAPGWSYKPINGNNLAMVWHLVQYDDFSICLVLAWQGEFVLEVRGANQNHDLAKVVELLAQPKFNKLLSCFERIDRGVEGHFLARERFNFSFGSPSDTQFGPFRLAWYAQFKTEQFLDQIVAKVAPFQTPEMTELLGELNRLTRR